jgi:hypothetical protein
MAVPPVASSSNALYPLPLPLLPESTSGFADPLIPLVGQVRLRKFILAGPHCHVVPPSGATHTRVRGALDPWVDITGGMDLPGLAFVSRLSGC